MLLNLKIKVLNGLFVSWMVIVCVFQSTPVQAQQHQANGYSFEVTTIPGWVALIEPPDNFAHRPGLSVAYRLVDRQITIKESGNIKFTRLVSQPLTEAGLQQAAEIEMEFNPAFETLFVHELSLKRKGKTVGKLRPEQVRLIQRERNFEDKLYDGIVTAVIIIEDVRVNDVIDLAYSIKGRNPVFGDKYFSSHAMAWAVPVDFARLRLLAPESRKFDTRAINKTNQPDISSHAGQIEYVWTASDIPAISTESDAPSWYHPFHRIQITEYRHWNEVSSWAKELYSHTNKLPVALTKTLQAWRKEEPDQKNLAARALRLVQDEVRYFGIELGQNSHRPRTPNEVYKRRYGDCKDKTSLLIAMLDHLGIKAYPALVSTGYQRDIDNWLPTPGLFDHVIVMTELGGKRYWLDGTRNYQQGSLDTLGMPDYERALIVRDQENRLIPIDIPESGQSEIDIEEEFHMTNYGAPVTLTVKSTYRGSQAEEMRKHFANNSPKSINRSFLNFYAKLYPSITAVKSIVSNNDAKNNRFMIQEQYQVNAFWEPSEKGQEAMLYASTIKPYIKKPEALHRSAPLAISHPIMIHHRSSITYPDDIDYKIEEAKVAISNPFMRYQRTASYNNRKLTISHEYASRKEVIMPAQLNRYVDDLNQINDSLYYSSWVSETNEQDHVDSMVKKLLNRLDLISTQ
ncbi:MAG: DUF3857 domain-containing transglutaminase family protein [Thiotrichaceae bacterium]